MGVGLCGKRYLYTVTAPLSVSADYDQNNLYSGGSDVLSKFAVLTVVGNKQSQTQCPTNTAAENNSISNKTTRFVLMVSAAPPPWSHSFWDLGQSVWVSSGLRSPETIYGGRGYLYLAESLAWRTAEYDIYLRWQRCFFPVCCFNRCMEHSHRDCVPQKQLLRPV